MTDRTLYRSPAGHWYADDDRLRPIVPTFREIEIYQAKHQAAWYTGPNWDPFHAPMEGTERVIADRAQALGIRQRPSGYFYPPEGYPTARRLIALDWEHLEEKLDAGLEAEILAWMDAHPPAQQEDPTPNPNRPNVAEFVLLIVAVLAILLGLFVVPALADGPSLDDGVLLSQEQHRAAQVAAGEAPVRLLGPAAYINVLCTMANRLASPAFPDTLAQVVAEGYYANPRPLSPTEYALALDILAAGDTCGGPVLLYALSHQDVAAHGLPAGDYAYTRTLESGTVIGVHFYQADPWSNR